MALGTYAGLQASIAATLRRSDLASVTPDWITLAEAQMNQRLRVQQMVAQALGTITAGVETEGVPTDLLMVRSLRLTTGSGRELLPMSEEAVQRSKAYPSVVTGEPRGYVLRGGAFEFTPVPNANYTTELTYFQKIPALSVSNTTNWVLTDCPHAYLYGALVQSAPYLKADDRLPMWRTMFDEALDDIRSANRTVYDNRLRTDPGLRGRRGGTFNIISGDV